MKIAFIGQKGFPATVGGVETHVARLALGLKDKGHDVFVYARPWYVKEKKNKHQGINIIYKGSVKTKNFDTITHVFLATIDALKKNYDIIHYHGVGPALMAWLPKLFKPSSKVIITFHCIDRKHLKWGLVARFFLWLGELFAVRFADETIVVSKTLQKYCKQKYNADTIYIPNGIDLPKIIAAKNIVKKYNLQPNKYILFLSRLVKHKGAHYLIEAFNQLNTDMKLVIAGGGAFTDDYVKQVKRLAQANENIVLTGPIAGGSDIWQELYSNAYLFVLPSEAEGLPIVVLEAMSFGRCVLVSNISENIEAISGGFGFKFKNKSVASLRKKMQELIAQPSLIKKVGTAARIHVNENYNWKDIVKAIESVYFCVIKTEGRQKLKQCINQSIIKA